MKTKTAKNTESSAVKTINITAKDLPKYLKKIIFEIDKADREPRIGVVNGLAWTAVGGDVLKVEAISLLGKGNLKLTGQMGDVMKESAYIAYSVVKNRLDTRADFKSICAKPILQSSLDSKDSIHSESCTLPSTLANGVHNIVEESELEKSKKHNLDSDHLDSQSCAIHLKDECTLKNECVPLDSKESGEYKSPTDKLDIHLHIPEGAVPKDGPSAGITMACAIASVLFGREARQDVAMTGELNLSGEVLAIGGLKEKLIAAYKAEIKKALIPLKNYKRDLDEIPDEVKKNMEIIPVKSIDEVFSQVLV